MKLAAVVKHDKYPPKLRIDAAAALIRMKPRAGKRIGIEKLLDALKELQPEERKKLVGGLIPIIVGEMGKPPPQQQGMSAEEQKVVDPSIPFKDAAFGLLIYDKAALVTEDEHKTVLRDALLKWIVEGFEQRISISSQLYGVDQVLRHYKDEGAKFLPPLIKEDSSYDRLASLCAELGSAETKVGASQKLVELATVTESSAWFEKKKALIDEANKKQLPPGTPPPSGDRLNKQVAEFQEEQVIKVYAALKKVKGKPAVDYLLKAGADKARRVKVRQASLAALEGALDRNNPEHATAVVAIASADDTPDEVRDLAFVRLADLPRDAVAKTLYGLFTQKDDKKWKIRWVAAATLLKMSAPKDIPEFFQKLPPNPALGFAYSEPLEYGKLMGMMTPPATTKDVVEALKSPSIAAKLTAIGFFYAHGKASDEGALSAVAEDKTPLPKTTDAEAKWQCSIAKAGGKPGETEVKDLATVGDFVKFCVLPGVQSRK